MRGEQPVEVREELVVQHRSCAQAAHRSRAERPRRRVPADPAHLQHRGYGAELCPAYEQLCVVERRAGVAADVRAPGRKAAHRRRLRRHDRALKPDVLLRLVARPDPRHHRLRAHRGGAEDRGRTLRERPHHGLPEEQRVVVGQLRVDAAQVVLVPTVGLDPVHSERHEVPDPALVLGDHGGIAQVEDLVARLAERGAGVPVGACCPRRDPEHELDAEPVHRRDQASGVRERRRIERELPVTGLPRVVEQHPADRDPRRLKAVDVLEHLPGPVDDVAPLDQLQLGRRWNGRHSGLALVVAERLRERADVDVLVEHRALQADLGPVGQSREAARRHGAAQTAGSACRPREGEPGGPLAGQPEPPASRAGEERDRDARALVPDLDREDLAAQVDRLALLAAAEEVLVRRGIESVVDGLDRRGGMERDLDPDRRRGLRDGHRRCAPRLGRRDLVDAALGRRDLRQRVLVTGRGHLEAEPRCLVLGDDGLAVFEDGHAERARVDAVRDPLRRGAGTAACKRREPADRDQAA